MKIGIIGAMSIEVDSIIANIENCTEIKIGSIRFYEGEFSKTPCVVAQCGIGKVNAAICAQMMIDRFSPDMIINTGAAGGIGRDIRVGDVVVAAHCVQHDMDSTALGDPRGFISGPDIIKFPCCEKASRILLREARALYGGAHYGVIATGDVFVADYDKNMELKNEFNALACEMEGGSIAHVCYINGIRCAVLRAISDNADNKGKVTFNEFAVLAANQCVKLLSICLPELERAL